MDSYSKGTSEESLEQYHNDAPEPLVGASPPTSSINLLSCGYWTEKQLE